MKTQTAFHPAFDGLLHSFAQYPDRIAITDKADISYSYQDFYQHIAWCREGLQKRGVKKGTRILMAVPMSMELYAMMEAVFSLGGIIIFLDPWLQGKQMGKIIRKVKPELLICTQKIRRFAWLLPATWTIKKWWSFRSIGKSAKQWEPVDIIDEDIALITFTGGTGGNPKGADRNFKFLASQLAALGGHMKSADGKPFIDYTNFPIVGLADFAMGNHLVIPKINLMKIHEADPGITAKTIGDHKVSRLIVSPSLLRKIEEGFSANDGLVRSPSEGTGLREGVPGEAIGAAQHLKHIVTGGAPVSIALVNKFLHSYKGLFFEAIYGSTEAEPIALSTFEDMQEQMEDPMKGMYAGEITKEIELRIIQANPNPLDDMQFAESILKEGETGEILVTGDHVNKGYFENEEAFRENKVKAIDGKIWHRTGDIGYMKDGKLFLVGRLHRIIHRNGMDFHPYPIEFALERQFDLKDLGYVENKKGEICLFVGNAQDINESSLRVFIEEKGYLVDKFIAINKPLPRDPRHRSKLDTTQLLKKYGR